jgi:hypothetical protein
MLGDSLILSFRPEIIHFQILANILLFVVWHPGCTGVFPVKEAGIQVTAGLAPPSQTVGSLWRTPWLVKLARKMIMLNNFEELANVYFSSENSTNMTTTVSSD